MLHHKVYQNKLIQIRPRQKIGVFLCQIKNRGYYENDIGSVAGKGNHLPGRKKIGTK